MNPRLSRYIIAALVAAAAALVLWWNARPTDPASDNSRTTEAPPVSPVPVEAAKPPEDLATRLARTRGELNAQAAAEATQASLTRLRDELLAGSPTAVAAALLDELRRGADAPTGLGFRVGSKGNLAAWPTWRTWLLDVLGQVDPVAAATHSGEVYALRNSADEWSLAMRNEWRGLDATKRATTVRERARDLISAPDWTQRPTPGFLEGVDASVATLAWEFLPRFEAWLAPESLPELRQAGWVALEKLAIENPSDLLPALAENIAWLASQPLLRAGLMARADIGDERQRLAVEAYLARSDLSTGEAEKFFSLYPNVNAPIAHTLMSTLRTPGIAEIAHRDRAALAKVRDWRTQPTYARWAESIASAETRLAASVEAAVRGGLLPP